MPNIEEVKQQILPVKPGAPYIFVSYSSDDEDIVLPDVLELQKRGWNIWVDVHNVDKKLNTWTENAVKAINNFYCKLVLFYASQTSLISENCYKELSHTDDKSTVENHINKSVPFIAIETEEIKDIDWYQQKIVSKLNRSNYSPDRINKHAQILGNFLKKYFMTNNEKIRVHSKDQYVTLDRYYQEIEEGILKDSEEFLTIKNLTPKDVEELIFQKSRVIAKKERLSLDSKEERKEGLSLDQTDFEQIDSIAEQLTVLNITPEEYEKLKVIEKDQIKNESWYLKLYYLILTRLFLFRKQSFFFMIAVFLFELTLGYVGVFYGETLNTPLDYKIAIAITQTVAGILVGVIILLLLIRYCYLSLTFKYKIANRQIRLNLLAILINVALCCIILTILLYRLIRNYFVWF